MSQDLFSAFAQPPSTASGGEGTFNPVNDDDDEDFGDFETAESGNNPVTGPQTSQSDVIRDDFPVNLAAAQAKEFKTFPPKAPSVVRKPEPPKPEPSNINVGSHPFAGRMDLLFDAGDDEYDAGTDELADLATNPEAAMAYSKRIIAEQEAVQARTQSVKSLPPKAVPSKISAQKTASNHSRNAGTSDSGPKKLRKKSGYVPAYEPEVLFDAENVSDHSVDDWGTFDHKPTGSTTATNPVAKVEKPKAMPAIDLLGLDDVSSTQQNDNGQTSDNQAQLEMSQPAKPSMPQTEEFDDNAWDDFDNFETAPATESSSRNDQSNHVRTTSYTQSSNEPPSALAPTNIPPPSVLLSLFPPLFRSADEALFNTMTRLDLKQRQILLSHPASHQFLKGYLTHSRVLARIIAGRKLRWKRDQRLSQSMRIGPSAAGGKSGMKLTGVDKSEVAKEDREVLDTLDLWKVQVGKLRTAVTAASSAPGLPKLPAVPDIVENMPVRTLKAGEGGITAPHACALCGLRREERIAKVDLEVEDSFGEWWIQGMNMHVACKNFWEEFEKRLKSRR